MPQMQGSPGMRKHLRHGINLLPSPGCAYCRRCPGKPVLTLLVLAPSRRARVNSSKDGATKPKGRKVLGFSSSGLELQ